MRFRRLLAILAIALALVAATVGAGLVWWRSAPRQAPRGQPALARLDSSALPALRDAFNAHPEEARLIVLLSPT